MTEEIPQFGEPLSTYSDRLGAYAVILNPDKEVLVVDTERGPYLPGGGVDAGESLEDTLIREVFEETGIMVVSFQELTRANQFAIHPKAGNVNKYGVFYLVQELFENVVLPTGVHWMKVDDFLICDTDEFHQHAVKKALEKDYY